ncbi:MAG: FixH family protein [Gammaproteobacteria bacterium]|nr:FixH family protein [Gammaproteobacteria bacterium]
MQHEHQAMQSDSATMTHSMSSNAALFEDKTNAPQLESRHKHYRFRLYSQETPIPMKKIHSWVVHVEDLEGHAIENAEIFVFGGMPMHKHGFSTKPVVKQYLGNGDYLVEGIKFTMQGHWQIRFNIKHQAKRDRVVFDIHL